MPKILTWVKHSPKPPGAHIFIKMINITTEVKMRHCSRLDFAKNDHGIIFNFTCFSSNFYSHQEVESISPPLQPGRAQGCCVASEAGSYEGYGFFLVSARPLPSTHISLSLGKKSSHLQVAMLGRPCGETTETWRERYPGTPATQPPDAWPLPAWTTSQVSEQVIRGPSSILRSSSWGRDASLLCSVQISDPRNQKHSQHQVWG